MKSWRAAWLHTLCAIKINQCVVGYTISLTCLPKSGENLIEKAIKRGLTDEYSSAFLAINSALRGNFTTYGHKDWKELESDIKLLIDEYPDKRFDEKFYFDSCSRFNVIENLLSSNKNLIYNQRGDFFSSDESFEAHGSNIEYWINENFRTRFHLIQQIDTDHITRRYNPYLMKKWLPHTQSRFVDELNLTVKLFRELKLFMNCVNEIGGIVIILYW